MFRIIAKIAYAIKLSPRRRRHMFLVGCERLWGSLAISLTLPFAAITAQAGTFQIDTLAPWFQSTCTPVRIEGLTGEEFTVTWTDAQGVEQTLKKVVLVNPGGGVPGKTKGFATPCVDAAKKTIIKVKNTTQTDEEVQETKSLATLTPPSNTVVTALALDPEASMVVVGGNTFTLGGQFTTVGTSVDHDRLSPDFGALGGFIPAVGFLVHGSGAAGDLQIALKGDLPWMVNMGALWEAPGIPPNGISVPFVLQLIGSLQFGAVADDVIGSLIGDVTFFEDNRETIAGVIALDSSFGAITGKFSASGRSMLVPEPSTMLLIIVAGIALALPRARAYRHASLRPTAPVLGQEATPRLRG